jgi:hypothetical protein
MTDMGIICDRRSAKSAVFQYCRSFYQLLANRRKLDRLPLSGTIVLTYQDGYAQPTVLSCSCTDISRQGMGLASSELVPVGITVQLQLDEGGFSRFARICYCLHCGPVFRVGLEFSAEPANWKAGVEERHDQ